MGAGQWEEQDQGRGTRIRGTRIRTMGDRGPSVAAQGHPQGRARPTGAVSATHIPCAPSVLQPPHLFAQGSQGWGYPRAAPGSGHSCSCHPKTPFGPSDSVRT